MVRLSAVLANPSGADKGREYVAVINQGDKEVSLSGWTITTGAGKSIPLAGLLKPGEAREFFSGTIGLKNSGDLLTLVSPRGERIDTFEYGVAAEGQVLKPQVLMSAEDRAALFEAYAVTPQDALALPIESFSAGIILPAVCVAGILATLAVFVLKSITYDAIVENPFSYGQSKKTQ